LKHLLSVGVNNDKWLSWEFLKWPSTAGDKEDAASWHTTECPLYIDFGTVSFFQPLVLLRVKLVIATNSH
jgi:hypothetical protein